MIDVEYAVTHSFRSQLMLIHKDLFKEPYLQVPIFPCPAIPIYPATSCSRSPFFCLLLNKSLKHRSYRLRALLGEPLLPSLIIHIRHPEPRLIPLRPLKVIQQAPQKVTFDGYAFCGGPAQLCHVIAKIHNSVTVINLSIGGNLVIGRCTIRQSSVGVHPESSPVQRTQGGSRTAARADK